MGLLANTENLVEMARSMCHDLEFALIYRPRSREAVVWKSGDPKSRLTG